MIKVPISYGELVDKITILELKRELIKDEVKLVNIKKELELLNEIYEDTISCAIIYDLKYKLYNINQVLWFTEEKIRKLNNRSYRPDHTKIMNLSYKIHTYNDRRAAIKKDINVVTSSEIVEEKSYD